MSGLASLAKGLTSSLNKRKADVVLFELNETDDSQIGSGLAFQYFPESINDSKSITYNQKSPLGSSLPIYQWSNSGARSLSFAATFSTDVDLTADGTPAKASTLYERIKGSGQSRYNVDIRSAVLWLRRFLHPRYGNNSDVGVPMTFAPRKVILYIPNSGIGLAGGLGKAWEDKIVAVMTSCEVSYDAFFPSGLPRMATVQLAFDQVPQHAGGVVFPGASYESDVFGGDILGELGEGELLGTMRPYSIRPKSSK